MGAVAVVVVDFAAAAAVVDVAVVDSGSWWRLASGLLVLDLAAMEVIGHSRPFRRG